MAKFKPAGRKSKASSVAPRSGIPCVILVISGIALVMFFLYYMMKYASG